MRALVVFESMFGNTQLIAKSVADGLATLMDVHVTEVGIAPKTVTEGVDLLVVGGPTHARGMSRNGTRQGSVKQAEHHLVSAGIGIREWIESMNAPPALPVAAFDTRFDKPRWLVGSAARGASKRLRRRGYRVIARPESFFVLKTVGPLADGEVERARRWGERLALDLGAGEQRRVS